MTRKTLADLPAPDAATARQLLAALRLNEHIERVVADAPPLSEGQRQRIAAILRSGDGHFQISAPRKVRIER